MVKKDFNVGIPLSLESEKKKFNSSWEKMGRTERVVNELKFPNNNSYEPTRFPIYDMEKRKGSHKLEKEN